MILQRLIKRIYFTILAAGLTVIFAAALSFAADNVPRMTIQELKAKMDNGEKILILDVRSGEDYLHSKIKITGSIRITLDQLQDKYKELPIKSEIVTY